MGTVAIIDARDLNLWAQGTGTISNLLGHAVHHTATTPISEFATTREETDEIVRITYTRQDLWPSPTSPMSPYHTWTFPSGKVYLVGNWDSVRAHTTNMNEVLLGHVLVGQFEPTYTDVPYSGPATAAQLRGISTAIIAGDFYWGKKYPIQGHKEWSVSTVCPGDISIVTIQAYRDTGGTQMALSEEDKPKFMDWWRDAWEELDVRIQRNNPSGGLEEPQLYAKPMRIAGVAIQHIEGHTVIDKLIKTLRNFFIS